MSSRRAMRRLLLGVIVAALLPALLLPITSASAAYRHPTLAREFGKDGTPATNLFGGPRLAVNQSSNQLYAFDPYERKVFGFSIPNATTSLPLTTPFPLEPEISTNSAELSVATNSANGNIYLLGGNFPSQLLGFNAAGEKIAGYPREVAGENGTVAVDAEGHVAVANGGEQKIFEFKPDGTPFRTIDVSETGNAYFLAFDSSTNNFYVASFGGPVYKYSAASGYATFTEVESAPIRGIAYDASRGILYLSLTGATKAVVAYDSQGKEIERFAEGPEFEPWNLAIDEGTGVVYVSNEMTGKVDAFPGAVVPDVTTGEPVSNDEVSGTVDPAGGGQVTGCKVEYGKTTAYGSEVACLPPPPYSATENVTATLTGLEPEQVYHYRVVATNANGSNFGADETTAFHRVPGLRTAPAIELTRTCATLKGTFEGNGEDTHYYFDYGTSTAYGSRSATPPGVDAGSGTGLQTETYRLCGLEPGTSYHYRIVASNGQGTSEANDRAFTTVAHVEDLTTEAATVLSSSTATLHGTFVGNGEDTHYYFQYGFTKTYGNVTAAPPGVDAGTATGPQALTGSAVGLYPGTTYHFRVVASNADGTSYGEDLTFVTPLLGSIVMQPPSEARELPDGTRGITLNATVNPQNGGPTSYRFEYGPTTAYGLSSPTGGPLPSDTKEHPISAAIGELVPGVVYHYRLVIENASGPKVGPDETFQAIPNLPTIGDTSVTGIGSEAATVQTSVRPGNGSTVVTVDFGTTTEYGRSTLGSSPIGSDESFHGVSRPLTGLQPNTLYHYRVTAINFAGVTHGPDLTFSTAGVPSVIDQGVEGIGQTEATLTATISPNLLATGYYFEYGPKGSFANSTAQTGPIGSDRDGHRVSARITGLSPSTTYQYRVVADNPLGTTAAGAAAFVTAAPPKSKPPACKKGTVKRKGKCVKKKPAPKKKKAKKHHGHGGKAGAKSKKHGGN